MHGPNLRMAMIVSEKQGKDQKLFKCLHCKEPYQKHRLNVHFNDGKCSAKPNRCQTYPNLDIKLAATFLSRLQKASSDKDIVALFESLKPTDRERMPRGAGKRRSMRLVESNRPRKTRGSSSRPPVQQTDEEEDIGDIEEDDEEEMRRDG